MAAAQRSRTSRALSVGPGPSSHVRQVGERVSEPIAAPHATPPAAAFALHDAKNMLGVLVANVEYLAALVADAGGPPDAQAALQDLQANAGRLAATLRSALVALRGSHGGRDAGAAHDGTRARMTAAQRDAKLI